MTIDLKSEILSDTTPLAYNDSLHTPPSWSGPAYLVTVGKKPGIYQTWNQTSPLVNGISGATYKRYETYGEAAEILERCRADGAVVATDFGTQDWITDGSTSPYNSEPSNEIPAPSDLRYSQSKTYYVVVVGRRPGVYDDWVKASKQTKRVTSDPQKCKTWHAAVTEYTKKYKAGEVRVKMHK